MNIFTRYARVEDLKNATNKVIVYFFIFTVWGGGGKGGNIKNVLYVFLRRNINPLRGLTAIAGAGEPCVN